MIVLHNADTADKKNLWANISLRLSPPTFDLIQGAFASADVVMVGEIGGATEEEATEYVQGMSKAVTAFIAGAIANCSSDASQKSPLNKLASKSSPPQCK